ncbi:MAG: hypothetical protein KGH75_06230 [Rhodospirillales bacterium]|nr:hypothetical protein [Rhodospirillales bacterium]
MPMSDVERQRLYWVWAAMIQRCTNPRDKGFKNYGGRGITVCDRWRNSFADFLRDMGAREPRQVLDRIDNDAGYAPENCRWADSATSNANRRISKFVLVNGKSMCLRHACKELGLTYRPIAKRLANGWDAQKALSVPLGAKGNRFRSNNNDTAN